MLKALRSELVSRYDIADWLEEVLRKERQTYESNREKYQHVQPATHRRDYLFSPATVATDEAPFALSRVVEEPVTSRNNSRGLSDLSSEKDDDGEQSDVEGEQTFSAEQTADNEERNESRGHQLAPHEQSKENTGVVHDNHSHPLELLSKQKTEVVFATQDINREAFYRNKSFDNFTWNIC